MEKEIEGHELQSGRGVVKDNCEEEEIGVWRQEQMRKYMIQIYDSAGTVRYGFFALTCWDTIPPPGGSNLNCIREAVATIEVEIPIVRRDKKNGERLIKWRRLCNVLALRTTQISVHAFNLHSGRRGSMWKTWEGREETAKREERKEMNGEKTAYWSLASGSTNRCWCKHTETLHNISTTKDAKSEQEFNKETMVLSHGSVYRGRTLFLNSSQSEIPFRETAPGHRCWRKGLNRNGIKETKQVWWCKYPASLVSLSGYQIPTLGQRASAPWYQCTRHPLASIGEPM